MALRPVADIPLKILLLPRSAQQIINDALEFLANPPDPSLVSVRTANWRTGGPYRTLLYRVGLEAQLLYQVLAGFAGSAFLRTAVGKWLDWLGEDYFDEPRQSSLFATALLSFTIPAGVGPIGPVPVTVSTTDGKQFKTDTAVTFPAGPATLTGVPATAALAGSAYNVGAGNLSQLVSPNVLGVTVTNPAAATGGFDSEPDPRYAQRLSNKWGILAPGSTEAAYIYWALTASRKVQKVKVLANSDHGAFKSRWVTVVCSTLTGPVGAGDLTDVYNFIAPKVPLDVGLSVDGVVVDNITVTGTVKVYSAYASAAHAGIAGGLQALAQRVPIGGYPQGAVPVSEVQNAVFFDSRQVFDVPVLVNPAAPISLAYNHLLVLTDGTTVVGV